MRTSIITALDGFFCKELSAGCGLPCFYYAALKSLRILVPSQASVPGDVRRLGCQSTSSILPLPSGSSIPPRGFSLGIQGIYDNQ
jgi:hypothetical protein